jgi:hypothetical protein
VGVGFRRRCRAIAVKLELMVPPQPLKTVEFVDVNTAKRDNSFSPPFLALPGLYLCCILVTALLSIRMPGGAYYRVFGICPPVAALGMVFDNAALIIGAFVVVGTPWWYLVGRIGGSGLGRQPSLVSPLAGAAIAIFTCFVSTSISFGVFKEDMQEHDMDAGAIVQYALIFLLCLGALAAALYSLAATLFAGKESLCLDGYKLCSGGRIRPPAKPMTDDERLAPAFLRVLGLLLCDLRGKAFTSEPAGLRNSKLARDLCTGNLPSREAAKECSPRRKPCSGGCIRLPASPKGL